MHEARGNVSRIRPRIIKFFILVFLLLGIVDAACALDDAKIKKCMGMSQIAASVVKDRDLGMTYEKRVAKNKKLAGDMPALYDFIAEITKTVYFDLRGRPSLEISNAIFYACMQSN